MMSPSGKQGRLCFPGSPGKMCEGPNTPLEGGNVNSPLSPMSQRIVPADSCLNPALHSRGARGLRSPGMSQSPGVCPAPGTVASGTR